MEDMCQQWSENGYIGNPSDCTGWGYCQSQQLVSYGYCAQGQVYDPQSSTCKFNTNTACTTSAVQTCSVLTTPGFVADPTDCTQYAYCFGNGKYQMQSCPTGQQYAANNNTCVWGPSCPQNNICRFMKNNIFVGDPDNCGQYLQCVEGYGVWGQCKNNQYYNAALGSCQANDPCEDTPGNDSPGNLPPKGPANCEGISTFSPDSATCYGYFYCESTTSSPVWGTCPFGLEFDSESSQCVSPISTSCTYNRCANTNLTYAAVSYTGCKQYTYCPTGQTAYCQPGYEYFDEVAGRCVTTQPWYTICKATSTT
ncbi:GH15114 [Drosophila grimshawi]|uniref:GH15114 n=2 Tax=Drosophila grimshawi TaxID=7222 RepID=B4IYQ6_DROGR|nr:GH15114 [Drosophila grimshawi]